MTRRALRLKDVAKTYSHFDLTGVSLDLEEGSVMGLVGPNGAGKSTTIRIIMGLVHQDRGEVEVLGHQMPREQVAAKERVGFLSEDMRLYKQAPLAWHMLFMRRVFPGWDQTYADHLIQRFDLRPDQKLKGFSHGQRVKAAMLLVLARRPQLLVLDEPTTGLDPVARTEVLDELVAVLKDDRRTILFSSHNTRDVEQLSDSITFIDRGRLIHTDDKERFLDRWRRVRLQIEPDVHLPELRGLVTAQRDGRLTTLTTQCFGDDWLNQLDGLDLRVLDVQNMSLEEIFIANVQHARTEEAA